MAVCAEAPIVDFCVWMTWPGHAASALIVPLMPLVTAPISHALAWLGVSDAEKLSLTSGLSVDVPTVASDAGEVCATPSSATQEKPASVITPG